MFLVNVLNGPVKCVFDFYARVNEADNISCDRPDLFQLTRIDRTLYRVNTSGIAGVATTIFTKTAAPKFPVINYKIMIDNSLCGQRSKFNSVCGNNVRCSAEDDMKYIQARQMIPIIMAFNASYGQYLLEDYREEVDQAYCAQCTRNTLYVEFGEFYDVEPGLKVIVPKCNSTIEKCNRVIYKQAYNPDRHQDDRMMRENLLDMLPLSELFLTEQFNDLNQQLIRYHAIDNTKAIKNVESYYKK